jgi:hypothetical protein
VDTGRDLGLAQGVPIAVDLGCHMNDRMVSFYMGWGHPQLRALARGGSWHCKPAKRRDRLPFVSQQAPR